MTENIRALIVILVLAVPVLVYLRAPVTANAIDPANYKRRAALWLLLTCFLFLSYDFWLFVLLTTLAVAWFMRRDSNWLGLYLFLVLLAPPFQSSVQGFAGINRFLDVDYLRLLSLVIPFPVAISFWMNSNKPGLFRVPADKYLLGYLTLLIILEAPTTTTTNVLRSALSHFIDTFLPYYVFSRGLSDIRRVRDAFASFACAGAVIAVIALFETSKGWLLYSSLPDFLNVHWGYGNYMARGDSLRATVSTGHSIVLGYVLTIALGLHLSLRPSYQGVRAWWAVVLVLGAGLVASFSRGPWVGAAAMLFSAAILAPYAIARVGKIGLAAAVVGPLLLLSPYGSKFAALLPFVGDFDAGSVDYRKQLFTVSWDVLMLNPLLGSPYYMGNAAMEQLRQGEGIIDMVNTYMGVALGSGFIGLALFLGVMGSSALRIWRSLSLAKDKDSELQVIGRALLATVIGILTMIGTVGSVNAIPLLYWCIAGACAAYIHSIQTGMYEAGHEATPRGNFQAVHS